MPTNRVALRESLERLFTFLASAHGRTDANCWAVDLFFCLPEEYGWSASWAHVPADLRGILEDVGGALHDSVSASEIATNVESSPEQLLDRVRKVAE